MKFTHEITVEVNGHIASDISVVQAAKVSTLGDMINDPSFVDDTASEGLIRYLMKHRHGTPFEHNMFRIYVHAPIFVWREWHRHRIGFCVAGDTEVWTESWAAGSGRTLRKKNIETLWRNWNHGVPDKKGRIRFLGSVEKQKFRVLNEDTHLFESSVAEDVFKCGVKELYLLETEHDKWNTLKCSADHKVLTVDGWAKISELSKNEMIYVNGKRNKNKELTIPPSLRSGIGVWTSMKRKEVIANHKNRCYICDLRFEDDELTLDHVIPVITDITKALDINNLKPACTGCHRVKSNLEQKLSEREIVAGSILSKIKRKPYRISEEMTYDIAISGNYHNYIANGIVVHNSYNEESARYKKLDPVFYIPPADRPMFKVDDWKPGKPKFLRADEVENGYGRYNKLLANLSESYAIAYDRYTDNLDMGFDPGLARDCLPVGIYSSCWVTCNARSLMAFLSLRTHDISASQVSYPLYEIEVAARKLEAIFAQYMPITYQAFLAFGRQAP